MIKDRKEDIKRFRKLNETEKLREILKDLNNILIEHEQRINKLEGKL